MSVAQVNIYDGAFKRVGQIRTASGVRRTHSLHNRDTARFSVALDDSNVGNLNPLLGRVIVITSDVYPWPWVGKVATLRANMDSDQVRVGAKSYDSVLDERYLGNDAVFRHTAGRAFLAILGSLGELVPHGIGKGSISQTERRYEGAMPYIAGRSALDTVAKAAGQEWWLDHRLSGSTLRISASLGDARGVSRYSETILVHGAGVAVQEWMIDGEAASFAATVVGGQSSPIQAFGDRAVARVTSAPAEVGSVHGFVVESVTSDSLVSRREQIEFTESLRAEGRVLDAARVAVSRPSAQRKISATVTDTALWPSLGVGDIVRVQVPGAFLADLDAALRLLSVEVNEEQGELAIVGQVMGGRL